MMQKLTDKEEKFVLEYMKDLDRARAYVRAGYSPNGARQNAHRLLTKDYIQRAIEERKAQLRDENKDQVSRIRESLSEIAYSRDEPDNPNSDYKYSAHLRLKALELLGKSVAMFSERIIHAPEVPALSPEQIALLRKQAAILDGTGCVEYPQARQVDARVVEEQ